jgi:cell division septation protein DedD
MKPLACLALAAAALLAGQAAAQPAAVVEGVQMPAWVERSGRTSPVAAGMALQAGDQVKTGAGSRLLVKLSEGSLVKLGENGTLRIAEMTPSRDLFAATLRVLEGAFRFTTDLAAKQRRREVNITVATVTAGIRGTDLWGRSRDERQIVCLIEGKIEVGAEGEPPVAMDQPRQFYQREKGKTQPVGFVEPQRLNEWAKETEIERGKGAARLGGKWSVRLATASTQRDALSVYDQVRKAGYAAEIVPLKDGDKRSYLVRIRNLPSKAEASALADQLRGKHGVEKPTVSG